MARCKLCQSDKPLKTSHIIPAFFIKWFKDTSGTGYFRNATQPNLRLQDGPKQKLLCDSCEQRFGVWEASVAEGFFPAVTSGGPPWEYGDWLIKFAASLCWRNLVVRAQRNDYGKNLSSDQLRLADRSMEVWRRFLLGIDSLKKSEFHFLPVDLIESAGGIKVPANLNRYLTRCYDLDLVAGKRTAFVLCKLGPMFFLGFIENSRQQWEGTRINLPGGQFKGNTIVPIEFRDYMFERAIALSTVKKAISPKQVERVSETMKKDLNRVLGSESYRATEADIRMSGWDEVFPQ